MSDESQLYSGFDYTKIDANLIDESWKVFKDSHKGAPGALKKPVLLLDTIATHSGKEINDRIYPGVDQKKATKSFSKSSGGRMDRPFLKNHDKHKDAIGRVIGAEYNQLVTGDKFLKDYLTPAKQGDKNNPGSGFVSTKSRIMDEDAIEKFLDGRFQHVSIGFGIKNVFCSICTMKDKAGKLKPLKPSDESCGHWPGETVLMEDGTKLKCMIITGGQEFREMSQVNDPADDDTMHTLMKFEDSMCDGNESSFLDLFNAPEKIGFGFFNSPAEFLICDSEGHPLTSLRKEKYQSGKIFSITNGSDNRNDSEEGNESDEEFARLNVLDQLSRRGIIKIDDKQKTEISEFRKESHAGDDLLKKGKSFISSPYQEFDGIDAKHIDAAAELLGKSYIGTWPIAHVRQSLLDQAKKQGFKLNNEYFKGIDKMTLEEVQVKLATTEKALADAQSKATTLEEANTKMKADAQAQNLDLSKSQDENKALKGQVHGVQVDRLIELKKEIGAPEVKGLDEAGLAAYRKTIEARSLDSLSDAIKDLDSLVKALRTTKAASTDEDPTGPEGKGLKPDGASDDKKTVPSLF